jgi:hypothetical protein
MEPLHDVSYFFGGALLANAVPHFVLGVVSARMFGRFHGGNAPAKGN